MLDKQANFITMTQTPLGNKPLSKVELIKNTLTKMFVFLIIGVESKANNKFGRSSVYRSTFRFVFSILGALVKIKQIIRRL